MLNRLGVTSSTGMIELDQIPVLRQMIKLENPKEIFISNGQKLIKDYILFDNIKILSKLNDVFVKSEITIYLLGSKSFCTSLLNNPYVKINRDKIILLLKDGRVLWN